MRIHKSDAKAVAPMGCKSWKEIMGIVEDRALERVGVLNERRIMGRCMDAFIEA